jgi:hypothetical protein
MRRCCCTSRATECSIHGGGCFSLPLIQIQIGDLVGFQRPQTADHSRPTGTTQTIPCDATVLRPDRYRENLTLFGRDECTLCDPDFDRYHPAERRAFFRSSCRQQSCITSRLHRAPPIMTARWQQSWMAAQSASPAATRRQERRLSPADAYAHVCVDA